MSSVARARNSWLLSFADLITLLICFLIMLLTLNKFNIDLVHQWVEQQLDESYLQVSQLVEQEGLDEVKVFRDHNGILLTLNIADSFEVASTKPKESLTRVVSLIAHLLPELKLWQLAAKEPELIEDFLDSGLTWNTDIVIEGHTDNDPISATSPLRNNWQLSALRAKEVMLLLQEESQLSEDLFTLAGRGEHAPIFANDSLENKALNRRITIRLNASLLSTSQY